MFVFTEAQMEAARNYVTAERANPYRGMSVAMIAAQKALKALVPVRWDDDENGDSFITIIRRAEKEMGPEDKRTASAKATPAAICPRCNGTGNYSYNPRYGTMCFKCQGKGTL